MSVLVGVWVTSGARAEDVAPPSLRAALRRSCGPGRDEILEGPLWLAAPAGCLARRGARRLALMGLVAGPASQSSPEALLAGWESQLPAGHYSVVHADLERKILTLYRDLFGMARLYHASAGDLLLFSTHARALRAAGVPGGLDREAALEAVLSADLGVIFGERTLLAGIRELPPGEALVLSPGRVETRAERNPFVEPWTPGPPVSPAELERGLIEAVERAIGSEPRVAVALSGGIDSSLLAALAVETLGPMNVEAFTYEFDEPSHASETRYAALVCRRLGIAHRVVRVGWRAYVSALPELFWRLEAPRLAPGAWLPFSRALAESGFGRVLTGDGMELALGLTEEFEFPARLARALAWLPAPGWTLRYGRAARFHGWPLRVPGMHAGLKLAALATSYHMLLCVLRHNGVIADIGPFYPAGLRELARGAVESQRVREAVERRRDRPLEEQFRFHRLNSYYLYRLLRGKQTAWRELGGPAPGLGGPTLGLGGALPVCPALLLPAAPLPRGDFPANDRSLLLAAAGERVPAQVLARSKIANQSILPAAWTNRIAAALAPLAPEAAERLGVSPRAFPDLLRHYGRELALLALWARIFDSGPVPAAAPTLKSLGLEERLT